MPNQRVLSPACVYTVGDCPVGCGGDDLFVLRARPTSELFLYCSSCGLAYPRHGVGLDEVISPEDLAPVGIDFPTKSDVTEFFAPEAITEQPFEINDFWYEIARTYLGEGNPQAALKIVNSVLRTWHHPPDRAHELARTIRSAQET